jgi:hypothetical protein
MADIWINRAVYLPVPITRLVYIYYSSFNDRNDRNDEEIETSP